MQSSQMRCCLTLHATFRNQSTPIKPNLSIENPHSNVRMRVLGRMDLFCLSHECQSVASEKVVYRFPPSLRGVTPFVISKESTPGVGGEPFKANYGITPTQSLHSYSSLQPFQGSAWSLLASTAQRESL